jgi:hypothetical protein
LRQRVAFALSEIFVVSENGTLQNHADALSSYYDMLLDNAFGNYRSLLEDVTLHPAMGLYLGMQGNNAGSIITGLHADENYAREVQQLFSIGLNRLWPDGTLILNSQDNLVPTYNQNVVMGFASVFTGWNYYQTNQANGRLPSNWYPPPRITPTRWCWCPRTTSSAQNYCSTTSCCRRPGATSGPTSTNNDAYCSQDLESGAEFHFQQPERRAVHLPRAHPAAGHQQSEPRLRLSRRAGFQQRRHRRARQPAGGRPGDPAGLRGAQPGHDFAADLRQATRAAAARHRAGARLPAAPPPSAALTARPPTRSSPSPPPARTCSTRRHGVG